MKKIALSFAAASALLFAAGCSNNTSTENQSTNAAAGQAPPAMNANQPSTAGMNTNSAGMETNTPGTTTNNMTPP